MTELYLVAPADAGANAFAETLKAVLARTSVAALLLPRGGRSDADYESFVAAARPIAQAAGSAVLIEGEPKQAIDLGVDGLHVEGPLAAVKAAVAALKPNLIVGAGGIVSRHDAMAKGELGVDYIMFGPLLSGAVTPEVRDWAGWWAETMEISSILCDPETAAEAADAGGCEFLAIGDSFWRSADPVSAIAALAARLESLS
ncbi:MAG TPA: thiamine phosphate synthase [Devosiaceae bacterium]|nr:thiamine phosphate synthase [Devosiaceae bacterium]